MSKSWIEQLADLNDPTPKDFDPEANDNHIQDASESPQEDPDGARAHYVDVEKSKLRQRNDLSEDLGPEYTGSSISRIALLKDDSDENPFGSQEEDGEIESEEFVDADEDLNGVQVDGDEEIESDEAFESGDEERFRGYTFRGSRASTHSQKDQEEVSDMEKKDGDGDTDGSFEDFEGLDSDQKGDEDDVTVYSQEHGTESPDDSASESTSLSDDSPVPRDDDRATLRKMMAEEQKTVAASLTQAAKADIAKGRAIKRQRTTFDGLLNTRIKLQKALIATNTMSSNPTTSPSPSHTDAIHSAETAALNLWTNLSTLRSSLQSPQTETTSLTATPSTHSPNLWSQMQHQERTSLPHRRAILTKWSQKTQPITSLARTNKFSQPTSQQPLTSILDAQLSGSAGEKLINKTHIPRNCAPAQAAARVTSDPAIYDDADFYTLLLRELVDQRMDDSTHSAPIPANGAQQAPLPPIRDFKIRKQVDRKASKGRKMRYTVHEKLQNFMAPEDRGSWGERQREELFASLLGRRVALGEDEGAGDGEEMEGVEGADGLRLFG